MSVLVDSDVFIDHLRGVRAAARYLDGLRRRTGIYASILTRAELRAGTRGGSPEVEALLHQITWIPLGEDVADRAGGFARQYGERHPGIGLVDYLVAATAEVLQYALATRNTKHFPMFRGLRSPY